MNHNKFRPPFFRVYALPRLFFLVAGVPRGSVVSIDVTEKCNMRCRHCYFFKSGQGRGELSSEEWENRIVQLKKRKFLYSATWIGGEPLLRQDVIQRCRKYFMHNLIVTNGSIPLPEWDKTYFHISVDGYGKAHDEVRGVPGLYNKTKKHISLIRDQHVTAAMCINNHNKNSIVEVLDDFRDSRLAGFLFDFYTPFLPAGDDPLYVEEKERDEILDMLIGLKQGRKYGKFISVSESVLELMKSYNMKRVARDCRFRRSGIALCSDGSVKNKCMMGEKADCSRCGCVVPYFLDDSMNKKKLVRSVVREAKERLWGELHP